MGGVYMYVFFGILGEFASIALSFKIVTNSGINTLDSLHKKGYRISTNKIDKIKIENAISESTIENRSKRFASILKMLLFLIPGINIIHSLCF